MVGQVIWVEGNKQPLMVRKSDGGFGYGTTDMAALEQRIHVRPAAPPRLPPWLLHPASGQELHVLSMQHRGLCQRQAASLATSHARLLRCA